MIMIPPGRASIMRVSSAPCMATKLELSPAGCGSPAWVLACACSQMTPAPTPTPPSWEPGRPAT